MEQQQKKYSLYCCLPSISRILVHPSPSNKRMSDISERKKRIILVTEFFDGEQ